MSSDSVPSAGSQGAVTREELHHRRIDMRGFHRSDGLYEVEGRVTDRKPFDFLSPSGRTIPAQHAIHDMSVRVVFDEQMMVHDVQTFTDTAPYNDCYEGGRALGTLKGLKMASGWSKEVRSRLAGVRSCTHLMEILIPLATVAYQSMSLLRVSKPDRLNDSGRPIKIDSCYAYAAHREVVLRRWPQFHQPVVPEDQQVCGDGEP